MRKNLSLSTADLLAVEREYCQRKLSNFIKRAWPIIEPAQSYVHGWHIDAMAEHLEAVTRGEITRLLINVPPGCMKSLITGVFWPAWEWGCKDMPHMRYLAASHSHDLAIRDNMRMRNLVASDWYQELWPTALSSDQNAKLNFQNDKTGYRKAVPVASMTGGRGDRVIWDDPHSVEGAISEAERNSVVRIFRETIPTRLNNPEKSAIVIIMQRLHENDVSQQAIEQEYVHLMLPMEYEPERKCSTIIGFADPRTEEGELLFSERFSRDVVERDKKAMGSLAIAGQYQQRPAPRGGGLFKTENFRIVDVAPFGIVDTLRSWDKGGTQGGGAYTAGVKIAKLDDGRYIVLDVKRQQLSALNRENLIKVTAEADGIECRVVIEQEGGSGGKESAEATIRNLAGFNVEAIRPTGDKEVRATPYAVQVEAGNILLLKGEWNAAFIDEHLTFPNGKYKDQVDAAAAGFNCIAIKRKEYRIRTL